MIRIPSLLAAFAEPFYEVLDEVAQADFEYVEIPEEATEDA